MRRSAHAARGLEPSVCWAMTAPLLAMLLLLLRARLRWSLRVESSGGGGLCGAVPVSATIAAAPRRGSESAIALRFILTVVRELDVETSAATELACCGFAAGSHITHVQNCANLA